MPILSALTHLGVGKETTWGTPATTLTYIPVKSPKIENVVKYIADSGIRGALAKTYGQYQGPINATFDYSGDFFPDVVGLLLLNVFGTDTVTGSSSPYTHKFTLASTQPPSLTINDFDGVDEKQIAGARISELDIKFTPEAGVTWQAKGNGKQYTVVTTTTPSYSTAVPFLGWEAALTIGGTANTKLISFDAAIKRAQQVLFSSTGNQNPYTIVAGVMDVTGKMTLVMEDDSDLTHLIANDQPAVNILLTQPTTNYTLQLHMNQCAITKAATDRSKDFVQVDLTYEGIYNTTDGGPIAITLTNSVASY